MKVNRVRTVVEKGGIALGMQVMEFGTRGMAKILEYADMDYVLITWSTAVSEWSA
jgi:hypothetical protein